MTYDPTKSAQETEFKSVSTILQDAEVLITAGDFHNAANRIGHALAAAQACLDMQAARDNEEDVEVKMKRIVGLNSYLYQLTNKSLPEAMDVATFYNQTKPYKLPE
jgi:hypothetical protein